MSRPPVDLDQNLKATSTLNNSVQLLAKPEYYERAQEVDYFLPPLFSGFLLVSLYMCDADEFSTWPREVPISCQVLHTVRSVSMLDLLSGFLWSRGRKPLTRGVRKLVEREGLGGNCK